MDSIIGNSYSLWSDIAKTSTPIKRLIEEAVENYLERYGTIPNQVLVHPDKVAKLQPSDTPLHVIPYPFMSPKNIMVGPIANIPSHRST